MIYPYAYGVEMMKEKITYSQEQLDIALLKNDQNHMFKILQRLEHKVDSHFYWTMGSISVLYVSLIGVLVTALAKSSGWF